MIKKILIGVISILLTFSLYQQIRLTSIKGDLLSLQSAYEQQKQENVIARKEFNTAINEINESATETIDKANIAKEEAERQLLLYEVSVLQAQQDRDALQADYEDLSKKLKEVLNNESDKCLHAELPDSIVEWLQFNTNTNSN